MLSSMRAIVATSYGAPKEVLQYHCALPGPALKDVGKDEILVKVSHASINAADWHLIRADPWPIRLGFGLLKPRKGNFVPGADFSGVVSYAPEGCRFRVGDEVYGGSADFGAFAEVLKVKADHCALRPTRLSLAQAAALPCSGMTAVKAIELAGLAREHRVLVVGAGGGVGSLLIQMVAATGCSVTGLDHSTKIAALRSAVPAAEWIAYDSGADVTKSSNTFDVVFDAAAFRSPFDYEDVLATAGTYVLIGGTFGAMLKTALFGSVVGWWSGKSHRYRVIMSKPNQHSMKVLSEHVAAGSLTPIVDSIVPLNGVPEAIAKMELRQVIGKVVVDVHQH